MYADQFNFPANKYNSADLTRPYKTLESITEMNKILCKIFIDELKNNFIFHLKIDGCTQI